MVIKGIDACANAQSGTSSNAIAITETSIRIIEYSRMG